MSSSRDYHYSPHQQSSSRRSSPQDSSAGAFANIGQGGRTVLPPLPSTRPTSRSPAPTPHPSQYPVQRSYQGQSHYEYALPTSSAGEWYSNPTTGQPQASVYPSYQDQQQRYPSPSYYSQSSRTAQSTPAADTYDTRHASAPGTSHQTIGWSEQDRYNQSQNYTYGSTSPAHNAGYDTSRYQAPTPSYPTSYYPGTQMASTGYSYAFTPAYEPRNASMQVPYADPTGPAHAAASRSVSGSVARTTRSHVHASYAPYHPYTRHHHPHASTSSLVPRNADAASAEELAVKKKRKRADANQLKVLNEVYDRNPFPPTAERESLAVQLGMTPRSVQIWFQNKRQAARQSGRGSSAPTTTATAGSRTGMGTTAGDPSVSPSLPGPAAGMHSSSSLAHAVGVPSASAPRGTAGYVASPPRMMNSPPRMTSGGGGGASRPSSTTAGSSSTYTLRTSTSSPEDHSLAASHTTARSIPRRR